MIFNRPLRCKLTEDLTRYHPKLVLGALGWLRPGFTTSKFGKNFVVIDFDGLGPWDIKWRGVEVLDEEYKKEQETRHRAIAERLRKAVRAEKVVGPRGGFREFTFFFKEADLINDKVVHMLPQTTQFDFVAERWETELIKMGIPITKRVVKKP